MQPQGVLETALYCSDLAAGEAFYRDVVGLEPIARQPPRHVFFRCGEGVLLLFNPDVTATEQTEVAGAPIPLHGARGPGHVAFRVQAAELPGWRERLAARGFSLESDVRWPGGGESVYVRDPAGNSVEFATAALWGLADPA
ncbi:MAG TPA: VOC family protein [Gemmatimonadales bacterium]|nr:VOC family protein [Gemmatimonadales bacterium]